MSVPRIPKNETPEQRDKKIREYVSWVIAKERRAIANREAEESEGIIPGEPFSRVQSSRRIADQLMRAVGL